MIWIVHPGTQEGFLTMPGAHKRWVPSPAPPCLAPPAVLQKNYRMLWEQAPAEGSCNPNAGSEEEPKWPP